MEATEEAGGLLDKIRPPRLEDAGLEDCALPPESIKEAFHKAATAVRSIISPSSDDEAEGHCVDDPWPTFGDSSDTLAWITDGVDDIPGGCATEKVGCVPEVAGDEVAVKDAEEKVDKLVVGGRNVPEGGEACVDGLQELRTGEKAGGIKGKKLKDAGVDSDDDNDDEKHGEGPILVEGHV